MCTVTFIPFKGNIFITSNRDESPGRQSTGLYTLEQTDLPAIHFPLDETSRGSWIALSEKGKAVCLLNGANEPFVPKPAYRQSRGKVVIDAAASDDIQSFMQEYPLDDIAPFTLLQYEHGDLTELLWDGTARSISMINTSTPHMWSSATLYPPEVRAWRRSLFAAWLQSDNVIDRVSIMQFHQLRRGDGQNDFIMNRNEIVKTLSVTSIVLNEQSGSILHHDLETNKGEEIHIQHGR